MLTANEITRITFRVENVLREILRATRDGWTDGRQHRGGGAYMPRLTAVNWLVAAIYRAASREIGRPLQPHERKTVRALAGALHDGGDGAELIPWYR